MIYLASRSPRRVKLLSEITGDFVSSPTNIEEKEYPDLTPKEKCIRRAKDKCIRAVNRIRENGMVVISADTVVDLDGCVLDKPKDAAAAAEMLQKLSENNHKVYTAVSVYKDGSMYSFCCETAVFFDKIPQRFIDEYVKTDEAYDKAGGYAIQGSAGRYIKKIEGDYNNVVGLPAQKLEKLLKYIKAI